MEKEEEGKWKKWDDGEGMGTSAPWFFGG